MDQLSKDVQKEIELLENSVTEKQLAFSEIDEKLFGSDKCDDPSLLPNYLKAKKELDEAVNSHISFFKSVTSSSPRN